MAPRSTSSESSVGRIAERQPAGRQARGFEGIKLANNFMGKEADAVAATGLDIADGEIFESKDGVGGGAKFLDMHTATRILPVDIPSQPQVFNQPHDASMLPPPDRVYEKRTMSQTNLSPEDQAILAQMQGVGRGELRLVKVAKIIPKKEFNKRLAHIPITTSFIETIREEASKDHVTSPRSVREGRSPGVGRKTNGEMLIQNETTRDEPADDNRP